MKINILNLITVISIMLIITPSYAQTSNEDIKNFVHDYLIRNSQNSVDYVLKIYDDRVDFYNEGWKGKDFILKDKTNYFKKWSHREYRLTSEIKISKLNDSKEWLAEFNYHYDVSNNSKNLSGDAWCKLTILDKYGLKIIGEKGGLIKNSDVKPSKKEIVQELNGIKIIIQALEDPTEPSVFYKPTYDSKLVGVSVTIENNSKNSFQFKIGNFGIEDKNGWSFEPSLGSASKQIKDGEIKSGQ